MKKIVNQNSNEQNLFHRQHVFFCVNVREEGHPRGCCAAKGSVALRDYMKAKEKEKEMRLKRVRINASGCLNRCELGPSVVIYPEGVWYKCETNVKTWTRSLKSTFVTAAPSII